MDVAIVGGGIGGCALALSLHDAGITDVHVFEAAIAARELGVGINVLPHAVRELDELGLGDELAAVAIPTAELRYYNRHGQQLYAEPRGLAAGYRWPQYSIHRGELLGILHGAVLDRLGGERYHTASRVAALGQDDGAVWVDVLADGDAPARHRFGVVVGADGIHSVARASLHPGEGPPLWNGVTMFRGATVSTPFLSGRTMIMAGVVDRRVVVYPISAVHERRRGALVNWVAELRTGDSQPMPRQDWTAAVDPAEVLEQFCSFRFDWLDVPDLIVGAPQVLRYPMCDRDPLPWWSSGRITLLGDAAHPMYPVGSNGASQAILDARVLARELALHTDPTGALAAYDAIRRPATAAVVLANRQIGPEQVMQIAEERAPDGFDDVSEVMSREDMAEISARYKRTAGFDPEILNTRPSLSVRRQDGSSTRPRPRT